MMYHFCAVDEAGTPRLGYGDDRAVVVGETLTVEGAPVLCERGLHASPRILDALRYAPSNAALCSVELGGAIVADKNKSAGTERTCLALVDADTTSERLRIFARWCALSVAHLWDMPDAVRAYLENGDEALRAAAVAAAYARVAAYAAYSAARVAAYAAYSAADAAARAAAYSAYAAAGAAARAVAYSAYARAAAVAVAVDAAAYAAEGQEAKLRSLFAELEAAA